MFYRKEKTEELLRHLAAEFLEKEAGPQSLITVTRVRFDNRKKSAEILISVLPKEQERPALDFVSRKKKDFIDYLKNHSRIGTIPFISFCLETEKID